MIKTMKYIKDKRGLTLIELIATVGILAVGLVSILSLFPVGIDFARRTGNISEATILANGLMEEIRTAVALGHDVNTSGNNWYNFKSLYEENANKDRNVFQDDERYEVAVKFEDAREDDSSTGSNPIESGKFYKVIMTVYWPRVRALSQADRQAEWEKQQSKTFITFVRIR